MGYLRLIRIELTDLVGLCRVYYCTLRYRYVKAGEIECSSYGIKKYRLLNFVQNEVSSLGVRNSKSKGEKPTVTLLKFHVTISLSLFPVELLRSCTVLQCLRGYETKEKATFPPNALTTLILQTFRGISIRRFVLSRMDL